MLTLRPTHATRTRNLLGPQADKLAVGLTFSEGSGTSCTNIVTRTERTNLATTNATGVGGFVVITTATAGTFSAKHAGKYLVITGGSGWTAGAYRIGTVTSATQVSIYAPSGVGTGSLTGGEGFFTDTGRIENVAWAATLGGVADTDYSWTGELLAFLTGDATCDLTTNGTGATLSYRRGTILIQRTLSAVSGTAQVIFRNSVAAGSTNHLNISVTTSGITINKRTSAGLQTLPLAATIANDDRLTIVLRWSIETGRWYGTLQVNDGTPVTGNMSLATTDNLPASVTIPNAGNLTFNDPTSEAPPAGTLTAFYWWDWVLSDARVLELLADPHSPARPLVSADLTPFRANPFMAIPQADGCTFCTCGADTVTVGTPAEQIRVRVWDNAWCGGTAEATAGPVTMATAHSGQPIDIGAVTGLSGRYYWLAEISYDGGSTWYPFPGGRGTLYVGSAGKTIIASDSHAGENVHTEGARGFDLGMPLTTVEDSSLDGMVRCARTARDILNRCLSESVACIFMGGDDTWNAFSQNRIGYEIAYADVFRAAPLVHLVGNHEELFGFMEATDGIALPQRKLNMVRWRCCTRNPAPDSYDAIDNTIDWSENGAEPAAPVDDSTEWKPFAEWLAGHTTGANTYANSYVRLSTGGTWTEDLGLNNSPRRTYCAVPVGSKLYLCLDVASNCVEGPSLNNDMRDQPWGRLGAAQMAWAEAVADFADANGYEMIVLAHNCPNGIPHGTASTPSYYRRGFFLNADLPDDAWLIAFCQRHRVRFFGHGHDHGGAIGRKHNITHVSFPTTGSAGRYTQTLGSEMNTGDYPLDYGAASDQGSDSDGVITHFNQWGYIIYDHAANTLTLRQTCCDSQTRYQSALSSTTGNKWRGRYVGEVLTVAAGGVVALSEAPDDVYWVGTADNGDFATYGASAGCMDHTTWGTHNKFDVTKQGWYNATDACLPVLDFEGPFLQAQVIVDTTALPVNTEVRVHHAPRDLGTWTPARAQAATSGGGGALRMGL